MKKLITICLGLLILAGNTALGQTLIKGELPVYNATPFRMHSDQLWKTKTDPNLLFLENYSHQSEFFAGKKVANKTSVTLNSAQDKVAVLIRTETTGETNNIPGFTPQVISPSGLIAAGWLEIDRIDETARLKSVQKIEASKKSRMLNKNARTEIHADWVHEGSNGLSQPYTGKGVIVGIIDSGIDFASPDFSDENGTRIQYLVEFTADDDVKVWSKEEIDADPSLVTQRDGVGGGGHGTHVAGSAVGNGTVNSDFTGIAPEADIVFIKGVRDPDSNGGFDDNDVLDGVNSIFELADEVNKPAVVNLSLGGNNGPLDGSSLYDQFLTELQGEGKIIVAAAGNEGFDYLHTGEAMLPNANYFTFDAPLDDVSYQKEVWYDSGAINAYLIFAMDTTSYEIVGNSDWISIGQSNDDGEAILITDVNIDEPAGYVVHSSVNTNDSQNGDGQILFLIDDGNSVGRDTLAYINKYYWGVVYQSSETGGRFDATNYNARSVLETFLLDDAIYVSGDRNHSVGSPATAKEVISVGAYVSSNTWTTDDNDTFVIQYPLDVEWSEVFVPEIGEVSYFSSRGPTRDGRLAPVISAPGDKIFSVRSSHISNDDLQPELLVNDGYYLGMQGTSMASPMVTGVVALMLEANPNLSYDDIIQIFSTTAVKDDQTGVSENTIWGHGKIDAFAAISALVTTSIEEGETPVQTELHQNYPNPFNPSTVFSFTLGRPADVSITVYNVLGQRVSVLNQGILSAGLHSVNFDASHLAGGLYFYQLNAGDLQYTKKMTMIK